MKSSTDVEITEMSPVFSLMINNNYFPQSNFVQAGLFHSLPNSSIFEIHIYV